MRVLKTFFVAVMFLLLSGPLSAQSADRGVAIRRATKATCSLTASDILHLLVFLLVFGGVGIVAVLLLGALRRALRFRGRLTGPATTRCPFCAEIVMAEAHICKLSGRDMISSRSDVCAECPEADSRKRVLISYQKGDVERQEFVEALAHLVEQEGFRPWYDEWEIKAGDSLPKEIGTDLAETYGVIIVLSSSSRTGLVRGVLRYVWRLLDREIAGISRRGYPAREEFEAAITKRIQPSTPVIFIGPPYS